MRPEQLLRAAYAAFNAREIDAALALMAPDVDWPNAWEGGRVRGRAELRAYWERQFAQINSRVDPQRFAVGDDGRVAVEVHQVVPDRDGALLGDDRVTHVYSFRGPLITRMDVLAGEQSRDFWDDR